MCLITLTMVCSDSNTVSSVVYYVTPSRNTSCSHEGMDVRCATLPEYARNNESYFNASRYVNITMKFLPGDYVLRLNFTVSSNLKQLILKGTDKYYRSDNVIRVLCESVQFVFHGIEYIKLQGFVFNSCGGLFVEAKETSLRETSNYKQLIVLDSIFENFKASAVTVRDISLVEFKQTVFINNTAALLQFGGACTLQRVLSVRFQECLFQNNSCAQGGG